MELEGHPLSALMEKPGDRSLAQHPGEDELPAFEVDVAAALARAGERKVRAAEMERIAARAEFRADELQVVSQGAHPRALQPSRRRFLVACGERQESHGEMDAVHRQPPRAQSPREKNRQQNWDEPDRPRDQRAYWTIFLSLSL